MMGRLFGMISRVVAWGATGAVVGYIGVMAYEMGFTGGALELASSGAMKGAGVGLIVGAVIGFFRRT